MITLVVVYVFSPGREAEAEGYLRELIVASRAEPGCRTYNVHRAKDEARTYMLYEQYDDEAALEAHRATPHFKRFGSGGLQTVMDSRNAALYVPFS
ncbi:MAG: antibiotic biosynthesis monooxygenase [Candidatus Eremiobacteraeota bacterium]|nr:antibiotic biosynthesis monooxygenase [Candidatus Eremiobacteraeota bacterium]